MDFIKTSSTHTKHNMKSLLLYEDEALRYNNTRLSSDNKININLHVHVCYDCVIKLTKVTKICTATVCIILLYIVSCVNIVYDNSYYV